MSSNGDGRCASLNGYPVTPAFLERFEQSQAMLTFALGGREWPRLRYGEERSGWDFTVPCHDCRAVAGQLHAVGCDVEQCPRCGEQAIMCDCDGDGDGDADGDE